jgi:hypothetical protein
MYSQELENEIDEVEKEGIRIAWTPTKTYWIYQVIKKIADESK